MFASLVILLSSVICTCQSKSVEYSEHRVVISNKITILLLKMRMNQNKSTWFTPFVLYECSDFYVSVEFRLMSNEVTFT